MILVAFEEEGGTAFLVIKYLFIYLRESTGMSGAGGGVGWGGVRGKKYFLILNHL